MAVVLHEPKRLTAWSPEVHPAWPRTSRACVAIQRVGEGRGARTAARLPLLADADEHGHVHLRRLREARGGRDLPGHAAEDKTLGWILHPFSIGCPLTNVSSGTRKACEWHKHHKELWETKVPSKCRRCQRTASTSFWEDYLCCCSGARINLCVFVCFDHHAATQSNSEMVARLCQRRFQDWS